MVVEKKTAITVDLYAAWPRYRNDLLRVEARCFGANSSDEAELEAEVKTALFLAVIKKGDGAFGYCLVGRRWPDTAYINYTAIDPSFQDAGHLGTLMAAVEAEIKLVGYTHIERNCRIENGYADKVAKFYGERVLVSFDHASRLGPLRFFRITI